MMRAVTYMLAYSHTTHVRTNCVSKKNRTASYLWHTVKCAIWRHHRFSSRLYCQKLYDITYTQYASITREAQYNVCRICFRDHSLSNDLFVSHSLFLSCLNNCLLCLSFGDNFLGNCVGRYFVDESLVLIVALFLSPRRVLS